MNSPSKWELFSITPLLRSFSISPSIMDSSDWLNLEALRPPSWIGSMSLINSIWQCCTQSSTSGSEVILCHFGTNSFNLPAINVFFICSFVVEGSWGLICVSSPPPFVCELRSWAFLSLIVYFVSTCYQTSYLYYSCRTYGCNFDLCMNLVLIHCSCLFSC